MLKDFWFPKYRNFIAMIGIVEENSHMIESFL
jgi:hypothetical protein